MLTLFGV